MNVNTHEDGNERRSHSEAHCAHVDVVRGTGMHRGIYLVLGRSTSGMELRIGADEARGMANDLVAAARLLEAGTASGEEQP